MTDGGRFVLMVMGCIWLANGLWQFTGNWKGGMCIAFAVLNIYGAFKAR